MGTIYALGSLVDYDWRSTPEKTRVQKLIRRSEKAQVRLRRLIDDLRAAKHRIDDIIEDYRRSAAEWPRHHHNQPAR